MGGSESKSESSVKQSYESLTINESDINILSQQTNETIVNAIIESANNCTSESINLQNVELVGLRSTGKITIGVKQKQQAVLSFKCVNETNIRNDMVISMVKTILGNIERTNTTDIMAKLESEAKSQSEVQFAPSFGNTMETKSNVEQDIKLKTINKNYTNLRDIVINKVENNFNVDTIQNCLTRVRNQQSVSARDIYSGQEIEVLIEQEQASEIITNCINNASIGNTVLNEIASTLDIKVKESSSTKSVTDASAIATAESKQKGILESAGTFVESIGTAIGNILGGLMSPQMAIASAVVCCCFLILAASMATMYMPSGEDGIDFSQMSQMTGRGYGETSSTLSTYKPNN